MGAVIVWTLEVEPARKIDTLTTLCDMILHCLIFLTFLVNTKTLFHLRFDVECEQ